MTMATTLELPITVPTEILEKNPKFALLLKSATRFIDKSGVAVHQIEKQNQAATELESARRQVLQLKLVYNTMQDIILDLEIEEELSKEALGTVPGGSSLFGASDRVDDIQSFRAVLSRVEAANYLPCLKIQSENLPKLESTEDADLLLGMNPNLFAVDCHEVGVALQTILPLLLSSLQSQLDGAMQAAAFAPKDPSTRYTAFVQTMIKRRSELKAEKENLERDKLNSSKYFWNAMKLVGQLLVVLQHIGSDLRLKQQMVHDQTTIKWLQAKSSTMLRKLSVLQFQVMRDSYTAENVAALTQIRQHIVSRIQADEQIIKKSTKTIEQYQTFGASFMQLVGQYSKLLDQIADKKFALEQLQSK